jgi:hypothetical protein
VKLATVLEGYATEQQRFVVSFFFFFFGARRLNARMFIKKYFLFVIRTVCRLKRFNLGGKRFADEEKVETVVRKWHRQQSEDFCIFQISTLVCLSSVSICTLLIDLPTYVLRMIPICDLFTDPPSYIHL